MLKLNTTLFLFFLFFSTANATMVEKKDTLEKIIANPIFSNNDSYIKDSFGPTTSYITTKKRKIIIGTASYYADKYQGRKTANGEKYRKGKKTAAHKTLPFGTKVRVKNLATGKSVKVRINDRGPFIEGREIDLSKKAFSRIGNLKQGLLNVEMTILN